MSVDTTIAIVAVLLAALLSVHIHARGQRSETLGSTGAKKRTFKVAQYAVTRRPKHTSQAASGAGLSFSAAKKIQLTGHNDNDVAQQVSGQRVGDSTTEGQVRTSGLAGAPRLDVSAQWACVASVIDRAIGSAREVEALQVSAQEQIDSAVYALDGLLDELADVMPVGGFPELSSRMREVGQDYLDTRFGNAGGQRAGLSSEVVAAA